MGKTVLGIATINLLQQRNPNATCLWLAHRQELIQQAADTIQQHGVIPTIIAPWASTNDAPLDTQQRIDNQPHIIVASVQTPLARSSRPTADIVVMDEAHHHVTEQWGKIANDYAHAIRIGLTATPQRQDNVGLGNLFESLITVAQPQELIDQGYLVPTRIYAPRKRTRNLAQHPYVAWHRYADRKQAIVFAGSVKQCKDFAKTFNDNGIKADVII